MLLTLTALGKTALLIVAGTFIAFAIVTSIVIPRKHPRFPSNLSAFIAVCVVVFAAQMGTVIWATSTQEVEHEEAEHAEPGETETTPAETETTPAETETTPGETETTPEETETTPGETETTPGGTDTEPGETETETEGEGAGDAAAGKEVFASAGCGSCHTLADAGASGTIGPNLDEAQPSADHVVERVTNGQGAMPSFKDSLSEQQIADVAAYVSSVAGQ